MDQDYPKKRISKHRNSSLHVESNLYYGQLLDNARLFKMLGADKAKSAIEAKRNRTIILTENNVPRNEGDSLHSSDKFIVLREDYEDYTIMYLETLFDEIEVGEKGTVYPTREGMKHNREASYTFVICTGPKTPTDSTDFPERLNTLTTWRRENEEREREGTREREEILKEREEIAKERERNKIECLRKKEKCTYDFTGWGQPDYVLNEWQKDGECSNQCPICVDGICQEGIFNAQDWYRSQMSLLQRGELYCPLRAPLYCSWKDGSGCIPKYGFPSGKHYSQDKCSNYSSKKKYNDRHKSALVVVEECEPLTTAPWPSGLRRSGEKCLGQQI